MPQYTTQFTIFPTSNTIADASTNTWSCFADDVTALQLFEGELRTFYQACSPFYPNTIRQNSHVVKSYNRSDPLPRAPVTNSVFNFAGGPVGNPMPPEVSLCGSFQAVLQSGIPQSRRRGRIYLGPVNTGTLDLDGRPTPARITTLRNALNALRVASAAAATWDWQVFSTRNLIGYTIANGWVDNEFDTQRRRGRLATTRTVFP